MDPWQREDAEVMDNAWLRVVGRLEAPWDDSFVSRSYNERARGHSKTTDIAIQALYALFAAKRMIVGYVCSGSKDQAWLVYLQMQRICQLNPWLLDEIDIGPEVVTNRNTGAFIEILSSAAHTSIGQTPDFIIIDELSHWPKEALWSSVYSSAAKLDHCLVCIITNAVDDKPFGWHWRIREWARTNKDPSGLAWHFRSLAAMSASWISARQMNDQRGALTPNAFRRFWLNQSIGKEKFAIPPDQVEGAIKLSGPFLGSAPHKYHSIILGLDLGISHDHAAVTAVGCLKDELRAELLECKSWRPNEYESGRIRLNDVKTYTLALCKRLGIGPGWGGLVYDPSQAELMAEDFRDAGIRCEKSGMNSKSCSEIAGSLLSAFANDWLWLYPDDDLTGDLNRLEIKDNGMVRKLTAVSDEAGHADRAFALALSMPWIEGTLAELKRLK